ncbi:MAG: cytochrome c [bacterium]
MVNLRNPVFWIGVFASSMVGVTLFGYFKYNSPSPKSSQQSIAKTKQSNTLKRGRNLFRRHCVTCHGKQGRGDGPAARYLSQPPLNFHGDTAARMKQQQMMKSVAEGKPRTGMPPWAGRLSRQQRRAIVTYIQRKFVAENDTAPTD